MEKEVTNINKGLKNVRYYIISISLPLGFLIAGWLFRQGSIRKSNLQIARGDLRTPTVFLVTSALLLDKSIEKSSSIKSFYVESSSLLRLSTSLLDEDPFAMIRFSSLFNKNKGMTPLLNQSSSLYSQVSISGAPVDQRSHEEIMAMNFSNPVIEDEKGLAIEEQTTAR